MNPNFKKKKPLPYKNLGELYTEAVQGEPSINRFFETKDYEVYIGKRNDPKDTKGFEVDEPTAVKITRIINNIDNNTEGLIKDLLEQSGFPSDGDILTLTVEAFNKQNIDSKELEEVIEQKKGKKLTLLEGKLNSGEVFNIKENVLVPVVEQMYPDIDKATPRDLIDNLFKITPSQKTVGVGPGEVCIALFTNSVKGSPGDLICGDKKIEVKANGGRVGKSGYSLGFPTYAKIVLKNSASIVQSKYIITINRAAQNIEKNEYYKNNNNLVSYIENIKVSINNKNTDSKKIEELILQGKEIVELKPRFAIRVELEKIINALENTMKFLLSGKTPAWSQTVQDFFFNHLLTQEQIINGLIELRSEPDGDLESLRAALSGIITDENYFKGEDGRKKLDRLTLAIQTASYQCHEKFNYLLVINERYKAVSLKFDSAALDASFNQMLEYIDKYSLTTGFANDPTRKAISIELP